MSRILFFLFPLITIGKVIAQPSFTLDQENFISIATTGVDEVVHGQEFQARKFPGNFYVDGFGKIDSIHIRLTSLVLTNNESSKKLTISPHAFGLKKNNLQNAITYLKTINNTSDSIWIIEHNIQYENSTEYTQFATSFNFSKKQISYHYGKSGYSNFDSVEISAGMELVDHSTNDLIWFVYLMENPSNPKIVRNVVEFDYLDSFPPSGTVYRFGDFTTGIGSNELKNEFSWETTANGYRVSAGEKMLQGEIYDITGKQITVGKNYESKFLYFDGNQIAKNQAYIVRINDRYGNETRFKILP